VGAAEWDQSAAPRASTTSDRLWNTGDVGAYRPCSQPDGASLDESVARAEQGTDCTRPLADGTSLLDRIQSEKIV